jgi:GT2 family glycosyltransferase
MFISAVIPTKNRSIDLLKAVASVVEQKRLPDELIVVDQSDKDFSRAEIQAMVAATGLPMRLVYIYDPGVLGLVDAKRVAVSQAKGDVVCFLEDDVVLEPNYIYEMEQAFIDYPDMMGCCGVVTNLPDLPDNYVYYFHLFHRGIFYDARVGIHGHVIERDDDLIPSNYLSGGTSAFRRVVFEKVPFDLANGFFMLEDIDFSTRAARVFGNRFFINPRARLAHYMSPVNRAVLNKKYRRKLKEFTIFYKKHGAGIFDASCFLWLLLGLWIEAMVNAIRSRKIGPVTGYGLGIWDGLCWSICCEDACV